MRQKVVPDLFMVLLLFLLPLIFFAPVTLGDRTLIPADNLYQWQPFAAYRAVVGAPDVPHNSLLSDLVLENYAWKQFIRERLAGGELPLWNPYLFGGVPFLAAGQHSALYPLSALHYVLPPSSSYGWYAVIQLWLAGLCMLALGRGLGQRRIGALLAAVSWQLSAFFLAQTVFPMIQSAAAWLPLLILMVEFTIRARPLRGHPATLPWAAGGAVTLGLVIYAGHIEITYYTLLLMGFYAAARLLAGGWAIRQAGGALAWLVGRGAWLLAMVAIGLLLGAGQFVPLYELVGHNFRAGSATLEQVLGWAYPLRRLIAFAMPNFFGSPAHHSYFDVFSGQTVPATINALGQPINTIYWEIKNYVEGAQYLGILPAALAIFGLVSAGKSRGEPGRPYRSIFAIMGAIALTFVFGLPTYGLLYTLLPGINQLHSPFRWMFAVTLAVATLAGFGADALARLWEARFASRGGEAPPPLAWRAAGWFGRAFFGAGLLTLAGLGLSFALYPQIEPLIDRALRALALAETAFADARMFYSYEFVNVLILGLVLIGTGATFLLARRPRRLGGVPLWQVLAVAVTALDLMIATAGFNPAADPALLDFTPPAIAWLRDRYAEEGPFRITTYEEPGANTANANIPWLFDLEDVRGYDSIIPRQYTDYMALIAPQFQLEYNRVAPLTTDQPGALDSPLLDALNVRYLISETPVENPGWERVYRDEAVAVYENSHVMPRAYTLPVRTTLYYDSPEAFAALARQADPRQAVMIYDPERLSSAPETLPDAALQPQPITEHRTLQVTVDATVIEPSWLVLADSMFDGWRAFIRPAGAADSAEREIPVRTANGNFRAVQIDPAALAEAYAGQEAEVALSDTWTVRFRYSPQSVQMGLFLTFMAAVILLFGAGVWVWRRYYRPPEGENAEIHRVAKNSLMPIVMNLFNKGIDFAFAFVMLRVLGPENAGIYYYAVVVFGWFDILTNFGLNTYLIREVSRRHDLAGHYLFNTSLLRIGLGIAGIPLLAGFLYLRQTTIAPPLELTAVVAIVVLYIGLLPNSLSTGLSALFYAFEKAEYPAGIATIGTISKAVLGLAALLLGGGVIGLAGVSIITNVIVLAVMLWLARPLLAGQGVTGRDVDRSLMWRMLIACWPLMINHLLATVFYKIDVILMEAINGVTAVGWYSVAYKWLDALQVIPAFLSAALLPVMSRQASEDVPALVRTYRFSIKLLYMTALPVAVATTFLAPALILVLGGREFLPDSAIALQIMVWSIPFGWINSVTQYALIALDRQRTLTWVFALAVIFNIAANLIFLPAFSYRAAAFIHILSESLLLAFFLRIMNNTLRNRLSDAAAPQSIALAGMLWRPTAAGGIMLLAMAALWNASGAVALAAGGAAYLGGLIVLRPLDPVEQARLMSLLPGRLRERLARKAPEAGPT